MKGLLVDTNLLCLLVVGLVGKQYIQNHKRLQAYGEAEYDLLSEAVGVFPRIVLTPQIYAETSNLLRQTSEPLKSSAAQVLAALARTTRELNHPTGAAVDRQEYLRLGVTDSVILMLNAEDCVLLSDDLDLYLAASNAGYMAFNFNWLREGSLGINDLLNG